MNFDMLMGYAPRLLDGLWITLGITGLSVVIGVILAVPVALMRLSSYKVFQWPSYLFVFYFRGTPLLVQLFLIYYGSGQFRVELTELGLWSYFREAYFCAVFTLTLNTCAYTAEILRGAIQSVPKGEVEAGMACGMSGPLLYQRIILPSALRSAWPAYGNEVIFLMQASSLVSIITLLDLTGVARRIISETFAVYEVYLLIAAIYLVITYCLVFIFKRIEKYLQRHTQALN
ncbi:MAG: His/Glu/Gln/Arg/opine family amino acid ABC transporter permease subunit [Oleiphilaceae bacterium]|jgi:octopine/nopaline transport system permease protein/arginine/ornithine transport system permease protein